MLRNKETDEPLLLTTAMSALPSPSRSAATRLNGLVTLLPPVEKLVAVPKLILPGVEAFIITVMAPAPEVVDWLHVIISCLPSPSISPTDTPYGL